MKKIEKKLTLNKQTVAGLDTQKMETVKGGYYRPGTREECWTIFTCPITQCAPGCFD